MLLCSPCQSPSGQWSVGWETYRFCRIAFLYLCFMPNFCQLFFAWLQYSKVRLIVWVSRQTPKQVFCNQLIAFSSNRISISVSWNGEWSERTVCCKNWQEPLNIAYEEYFRISRLLINLHRIDNYLGYLLHKKLRCDFAMRCRSKPSMQFFCDNWKLFLIQ